MARMAQFSDLLSYVTPHRRTLFALVVLMTIVSALGLVQPWLAAQFTASLIAPEEQLIPVMWVMGAWFALICARALMDFLSSYFVGAIGESMSKRLRSRLFDHLQSLPLQYFGTQRPGDVLALLIHDADIVSDFVTQTLVRVVPLLLTLTGAALLMGWTDPFMALIALTLLPLYYLFAKLIGRRVRPVSRSWLDAYSDMVAYLEEHLGLVTAVKAFTREPVEKRRFEKRNHSLFELSRKHQLLQAAIPPTAGLTAGLGLLALLWVGMMRVNGGAITTPQLVELIFYAMLMAQPVRGLANVYGQVQRARSAADRLIEFLATAKEPDDMGLPDLPELTGNIAFHNVDFSYQPGRPVLESFSMVVNAGQVFAITGENGSGKSTIVHLLMRFADPDRGNITIDGHDLSAYSIESLRRQISIVAQHVILQNATIAENIAYGSEQATLEEIKSAATQAGFSSFVETLPDGYNTEIGHHGLQLSGGQRQKLSLARALLGDAPILILDEPTAMFDPEAEVNFVALLKEQCRSKTILLITHREITLDLAHAQLSMPPTASAPGA